MKKLASLNRRETGEREKEPERAGNDGKENELVPCRCASYYSLIAISVEFIGIPSGSLWSREVQQK